MLLRSIREDRSGSEGSLVLESVTDQQPEDI